MEYKILQEKYNQCCQLVTGEQLFDAFLIIQELAEQSHNGDLLVQLENYRETYRNILKYSFGEVEDPNKKAVYYHLLKNTIELADEVRESIISQYHLLSYCAIKQDQINKISLSHEEIKPFIDSLHWDQEMEALKTGSEIDDQIEAGLHRSERQKKIIKLFNLLWLKDKYKETEITLATYAMKPGNLPWWDQCLVVSAITLSVQRYFDEAKFKLLIEIYKQSDDQIWQRALIGIITALYQYNKRLQLYPWIKDTLTDLHTNSNFDKQIESIIIQFIKSRDTEKLAQKFRDEIMPEMARYQSRIYDKLDMKNLIQDPIEDKNPDWEHVFEDSPGLVNKLEEFSMLQMEGSDVMLSTFSMLKQFDFFNILSNWFLPFHSENAEMLEIMHDSTESFNAKDFATGMEKSSILCNSDKHSFCLNVNRMPLRERSMMVQMFNMELEAMEEMAHDDDMLRKPTRERVIYTQYIQDLYRFNKLYPNNREFYDIFSTHTDFHNTFFFPWLIKDENIVRNIGEFFFEKGHYKDAIDVFMQMDTLPENYELWQKIAYSWQKLGNYQKALEYYLRADLTDMKKSWNIKKIALCYRRLGNDVKALEYYLEAEKLEPENLQVQTNLAHIYFDTKDFEKALKIYFKVEYLAPDNHKIQRPIAWCSLMLGRLDVAKKYFEKILESEGNQHDLLNLGHIEWSMGNKSGAIERYRQSIQKAGNDFKWFTDEFMNDSEVLIRFNIDPVDISLMRDYVKQI